MKRGLWICCAVMCFWGALAQGQNNGPTSGCVSPGFDQFDFWVGEWEVFANATGNKAGENSIQKQEQGCVLIERWQGASGGSGMSMNYYNPVLDQWRQLWVSANRYAIDIVGGLQNGVMQLEGKIHYFQGASQDFRGSWSLNDDGSVRQFFEQFDADSEEWQVWFDGRYVRKSE